VGSNPCVAHPVGRISAGLWGQSLSEVLAMSYQTVLHPLRGAFLREIFGRLPEIPPLYVFLLQSMRGFSQSLPERQ